jgi:hypothetical protein
VLAAFAITVLTMVVLAGKPEWYTGSGLPVTPYVYQSKAWGLQVVARGEAPYVGAPLEYPPGLLPFILAPAWLLHTTKVPYLPTFVFLMVVVDALGLIGLRRLSAAGGSAIGPWIWVVGLAFLGPMVLLRLDLVPAVATIWCLERVTAGAPATGGAFLGFGILAKVYPVFLAPPTLVLVRSRRRFVVGSIVVLGLGVLPFLFSLGALIRSVAGFHLARGIQFESLWGNALLIAKSLGYEARIVRAFGSWEIVAGVVPLADTASTALSIGVVVWFTWWAWRFRSVLSSRHLATVWLATLTCLLITGRVLSPQFVIWPIALAAVAACTVGGISRGTVAFLLAAALSTQVGFPFLFEGLQRADAVSIIALTVRNLCLLLAAVFATRDMSRLAYAPASGSEDPAGVPRSDRTGGR